MVKILTVRSLQFKAFLASQDIWKNCLTIEIVQKNKMTRKVAELPC